MYALPNWNCKLSSANRPGPTQVQLLLDKLEIPYPLNSVDPLMVSAISGPPALRKIIVIRFTKTFRTQGRRPWPPPALCLPPPCLA